MAFVFHVEFGINETPLTRALEQGNYANAERLIHDCPNSSYLDDGCYQRFPLYICLCGVDEYSEKFATRNFYLARLLIEHGANVNHRVPVTNFGSEFISPGKSSLELLVDFFIHLSYRTPTEELLSQWHHRQHEWNPLTERVVGLNKQYISCPKDVKEDVLELIFSIVRHGGDVNVLDENHMTVLHRLTMHSNDISLMKLLCENGAEITAVDSSGNSPLLSLCSVAACEDNDIYSVSSFSESDIIQTALGGDDWHAKYKVKIDFLHYLLQLKEIAINHQNNDGQAALFHCILRDDVHSAHSLLEAGANPSLQGYAWESRRKKRKLSPLFASFMALPFQHSLLQSSLCTQSTRKPQAISSLVDAGYFTTEEVISELSHLIESDFPEFTHLSKSADLLLHLMFGYRSASLKQLAARQVFKTCFLDNAKCLHSILPASSIQDFTASELQSSPRKYEEYIRVVLNCTVLHQFMKFVCLPQSLLIHFESQLLFLRMSAKFCGLQAQRPMQTDNICNIQDLMESADSATSPDSDSEDENIDSNISSENDIEGDSDLEYW